MGFTRIFSLCMSNCTRVFWFFLSLKNLLTLLVCALLSQIVGAWVRNSLFLLFLNLVRAIFLKKINCQNIIYYLCQNDFFSFCTFQLEFNYFSVRCIRSNVLRNPITYPIQQQTV